MKTSVFLAGICAAMAMGSGAAYAQQITTQTFDTPLTLSASPAPGAWYVDRYAPAGFFTSGGVLHENISGSDFQAIGFRNTQGRSLDLAPGVIALSVDLFVSQDYVGSNQRLAGLWGVGNDGLGISAYPIVELTSSGGALRFRGYNVVVDTFTDLGLASLGWQTLSISLNTTTDQFTYGVNGFTGTAAGNGSQTINRVILQGHNAGVNQSIMWDNLTTTAVPEPATWAFMILGFGGVGAVMRRKTVRALAA